MDVTTAGDTAWGCRVGGGGGGGGGGGVGRVIGD